MPSTKSPGLNKIRIAGDRGDPEQSGVQESRVESSSATLPQIQFYIAKTSRSDFYNRNGATLNQIVISTALDVSTDAAHFCQELFSKLYSIKNVTKSSLTYRNAVLYTFFPPMNARGYSRRISGRSIHRSKGRYERKKYRKIDFYKIDSCR